ncbi:MAG TPA: hypothetical protein VGS79_24705 [Puia sp.]|nr:hypothetical protein [Puia sp.]
MKRSIIILLFLPVLYTQLGYFGQFIWRQWQLKEAARLARLEVLPDAEFVRIDQAEIDAAGTWEERGKECRYHGHMYDVMRSKTINGATWLFCLDDENEERLDRQSDLVMRANQDQPSRKTGHALSLSIGDLICERPHWSLAAPFYILRKNAYVDAFALLAARYPEIAGPPPKV